MQREDVERMRCANCGADLSVIRMAACCSNPAPDETQTLLPITDKTLADGRYGKSHIARLEGKLWRREKWLDSYKASNAALQAEVAALIHDIERAKEQHMHLLAERDAAFAAGQEEMRERAAEAVSYLGRMKGLRGHGVDAPEVAHLIRALPIKPRP